MNIGLIGCGLIGAKRLENLPKGIKVCIVSDTNLKRAQDLSLRYKCGYTANWQEVVNNPTVDVLIIATTNDYLAKIATLALKANKHVLVEKPGARNLKELKELIKVSKLKKNLVIEIGYNHRFHPGIIKAHQIVSSKKYGDVMFIRGRYGHGGRLGYEKEWRFDPEISGGGELLDQGSHLIDLANLFIGEMTDVFGITANYFWKSKLEDSSFFILKNKKGQIAHLSATAVEWKNIFILEIFMQKAKIQIDGLGRSYGKETLTLYEMRPEMGPPDIKVFEFDQDNSWNLQNKIFFSRIKNSDYSNNSLNEAAFVLKTIERIYKKKK